MKITANFAFDLPHVAYPMCIDAYLKERERRCAKIEVYAQDPSAQAINVKPLKGREGLRLRVGDWRVIMDDRGNVLAILDIGPRGGVYD